MEGDMIFDQAKQLVAGMSENPELLTTPIGEKSESVEFPEKICRGLSANEVECVLLEQGVLFWDKRKKIDGIYEPNESNQGVCEFPVLGALEQEEDGGDMKGIFFKCVDESSQKSKWEEFRKFAKGDITNKCSNLLRDMELTESEEEDSYVGEDVISLRASLGVIKLEMIVVAKILF